MKIKSLAGTGDFYTIGTLTLDAKYGGRKWIHVQATEQVPGYEKRTYGSAATLRIKGKVWDQLNEFMNSALLAHTVSLAGTGRPYIQIGIRADGKHFQVIGWPPGNRDYGFAFDVKE